MPGEEKPQVVRKGVGPGGLLRGKVAQLINVRQLAINLGSKQGVTEGMEFDVLNRNAGEVHDPDTNKVLGSITLSKVRVEVVFVDEEFSIAVVKGWRPSSGFGLASWLYTDPGGPLTLKRGEHHGVEEIDAKDSVVQVGDPVIQVKQKAP